MYGWRRPIFVIFTCQSHVKLSIPAESIDPVYATRGPYFEKVQKSLGPEAKETSEAKPNR
jgi:hypothetical protein